VQEARCLPEAQAVLLRFRLGRGGFATAVLRELLATADELPDDDPAQSAASST
jgi:tRNA(Glu) U13 pseudouridine synthase TruD